MSGLKANHIIQKLRAFRLLQHKRLSRVKLIETDTMHCQQAMTKQNFKAKQ